MAMLDPVVVTSLQITAKFCKNRYKSFTFYPYIAPSYDGRWTEKRYIIVRSCV